MFYGMRFHDTQANLNANITISSLDVDNLMWGSYYSASINEISHIIPTIIIRNERS